MQLFTFTWDKLLNIWFMLLQFLLYCFKVSFHSDQKQKRLLWLWRAFPCTVSSNDSSIDDSGGFEAKSHNYLSLVFHEVLVCGRYCYGSNYRVVTVWRWSVWDYKWLHQTCQQICWLTVPSSCFFFYTKQTLKTFDDACLPGWGVFYRTSFNAIIRSGSHLVTDATGLASWQPVLPEMLSDLVWLHFIQKLLQVLVEAAIVLMAVMLGPCKPAYDTQRSQRTAVCYLW